MRRGARGRRGGRTQRGRRSARSRARRRQEKSRRRQERKREAEEAGDDPGDYYDTDEGDSEYLYSDDSDYEDEYDRYRSNLMPPLMLNMDREGTVDVERCAECGELVPKE